MAGKLNDAYILELIDKIDQLEQKVDGLPDRLDKANAALVANIAALEKAGYEFRLHVERYANEKARSIIG